MASMAIRLKTEQVKAYNLLLRISPSPHFFSSSTSNNGGNQEDTPKAEAKPHLASNFSDVRARLKQQNPQQQQVPPRPLAFTQATSSVSNKPSKIASLEEIRKNLSEFHRRSSVNQASDPSDSKSAPPQRQQISFQQLYKRNVMNRDGESSASRGDGAANKISFDEIRESLRRLREDQIKKVNKPDPMSLAKFKESLRSKPLGESERGGEGNAMTDTTLPSPSLRKGMMEAEKKDHRTGKEGDEVSKTTEFMRMYSYGELGEKLRLLRPEGVKEDGQNWFSLEELNGRLAKLRDLEVKEMESKAGSSFMELRESIYKLKKSEDEKHKQSTTHRLDLLVHLAKTPNFMLASPNEDLIEKYFHPDNMSAAEKMKIELKKVRDEFKMSESDCGSTRVQIAQLTTEISHLSAVLHKKDKHSRKGLLAKVQKRKTLLKYLRRTDWDSYCMVLSRLGLRDNPDYRN